MKKIFYLLLCLFLFSTTLKAASLDRFVIKSEYLFDATSLRVSATTATSFIAEYRIIRALKNYGYENINWIVTVVAQKPGQSEINLTEPLTLTESTLDQSFNDRTITASIPANLVGAIVRLKYEYLTYNANGLLINNLRNTSYSTYQYTSALSSTTSPNYPGVPYNVADLKLFCSNMGPNVSTGNFRKVSWASGGYNDFAFNWANIEGVTSLGGFLYVSQAGNLHKVNPNGNYTILGNMGDWAGTQAIASSANGYIYIVQNSHLHKVNATTGDYAVLGGPIWGGTEGMVAYGGNLFIVQNQSLHKVDENTGNYVLISGQDWGGTQAIASSGDGWIYLVQNSYLHKVSTIDGSYTILGDQVWSNTNTKGMTYYDGYLYILQNSRLHRVNKDNGEFAVLGNPNFVNSKHLAALQL